MECNGEKIEYLQEELFGKRYRGAALGEIRFSGANGEMLKKWLEGKKNNFLVILGPPGCGKTYICAALYAFCCDKFHFIRAFSEQDLFKRLRHCISSNSGDYLEELTFLTNHDLIILDDVGSSGMNAWREEIFFEFVNLRYKMRGATIITSNFSFEDFEAMLKNRIASRLFSAENCIIDLTEVGDLRQEGL